MAPELPRVTENDFAERDGVNHVASVVNRARLVWRETLLRDVGIDGQIEHVNSEGQATGHMVFVQVKSGESFFSDTELGHVRFYPREKHRAYWERAASPVILVLHDPRSNQAIWVDARDQLRRNKHPILIPRSSVFDEAGVVDALGPTPLQPVSFPFLVDQMINNGLGGAFPVDYLDLFVHGLVDFCKSIYFDVALAVDIADSKLQLRGAEFGVGLGQQEYNFLLEFVRFLIQQDLARVDFDNFWRHWDELEVVGRFLAPLTRRGLALVEFLSDSDTGGNGIRAIQDKFFTGVEPMEVHRRVARVEELKRALTGQGRVT